MEKKADDTPLPDPVRKVGIVYNLKKGVPSDTPDAEAEYDNIGTVQAISSALEAGGYETVLLEANEDLPDQLRTERPDIVFNIAEGFRGRGREAQIPALLNMLGIPFTGSDETTLCICLDKAVTKRLAATYHIRTPKYSVLEPESSFSTRGLKYPIIVKPAAEGSSKGISDVCVAASRKDLEQLARRDVKLYGEPMLLEEYISGREFTVGLLGNGKNVRVFSPMEIRFSGRPSGDYDIYSYNVKQDYQKYVNYQCPAELSPEAEKEMKDTALKVFHVLGCRDFARVDFRLSPSGELYFIEVNPLPGLAPGYSDYPMLAGFCGMSYNELVLSVLRAGIQRCGLTAAEA